VACPFDFAGEFTLAAGAVPGLAARLDFSRLIDIAFKGIDLFVVEAFTLWTVDGMSAASHPLLSERPRSATAIIFIYLVL
jgi:hypothetical protein